MASKLFAGIGAVMGAGTQNDWEDQLIAGAAGAAAGYNLEASSRPLKVALVKSSLRNFGQMSLDTFSSDIDRAQSDIARTRDRLRKMAAMPFTEAGMSTLSHNLETTGLMSGLKELAPDARHSMVTSMAGTLSKQLNDPAKLKYAHDILNAALFKKRLSLVELSGVTRKPEVFGSALLNNMMNGLIQDHLTNRFGYNQREAKRIAGSLLGWLGTGDFLNVYMTDAGLKFGVGRNERHIQIPYIERLADGSEGASYVKSVGGSVDTYVAQRFNPFAKLFADRSSFEIGGKSFQEASLGQLKTGYVGAEYFGLQSKMGNLTLVLDFDRFEKGFTRSLNQYIAGNQSISSTSPSTGLAKKVSATISLKEALRYDKDNNLVMGKTNKDDMLKILSRASLLAPGEDLLANIPKLTTTAISRFTKAVNPLGSPFHDTGRSELSWARDTFSVQGMESKPDWMRNRMGGSAEVSDFVKESSFGTRRVISKQESDFLLKYLGSDIVLGDGQGLGNPYQMDKLSSALNIQMKLGIKDGKVLGLENITSNLNDVKKMKAIQKGAVIGYDSDGAPVKLGSQYSHALVTGLKLIDDKLILNMTAFAHPGESGYMKLYSSDSKLGLQILTKGQQDKLDTFMGLRQAGALKMLDSGDVAIGGRELSPSNLASYVKKHGFRDYRELGRKRSATIISDAANAGLDDIMAHVEAGDLVSARKQVVTEMTTKGKLASTLFATAMGRFDSELQAALQNSINSIVGKSGFSQEYNMNEIRKAVDVAFQLPEDFKVMDVAYRTGHLQLITGAGSGKAGSMSRLHHASMMYLDFGADKSMAGLIIDTLTTRNDEALYEIDMLRKQGAAGTLNLEALPKASLIMADIFAADAPNRSKLIEQLTGQQVNGNIATYGLSSEIASATGMKLISVPLMSTGLSGINEYGVDTPTMKALDKKRLEVIQSDIDYKMAKTEGIRRERLSALTLSIEGYNTMLKDRFGGDGVAKAALKRGVQSGGYGTARVGGGAFAEYVGAQADDSIVGISKLSFGKYRKAVEELNAGQKTLEMVGDGPVKLIDLVDLKTGGRSDYMMHLSREPAQGIGSFGGFKTVVDTSMQRKEGADLLYFTENNPLSRTASMDFDGDIIHRMDTSLLTAEQSRYYKSSMAKTRGTLNQEVMQDMMSVLGKKAKVNNDAVSGIDFLSVDSYIQLGNIDAQKARLHKTVAAEATRTVSEFTNAINMYLVADPQVKAALNMMSYSLTELLLKSKHLSALDFQANPGGAAVQVDAALNEMKRQGGMNPQLSAKLGSILQELLLPNFDKIENAERRAAAQNLYGSAIDNLVQSVEQNIQNGTYKDFSEISEVKQSGLFDELQEAVFRSVNSRGSAGSPAGAAPFSSMAESLVDQPRETIANVVSDTGKRIADALSKNKGKVGAAMAVAAGLAVFNRTTPVGMDVTASGRFESEAGLMADPSARALPKRSATGHLDPMEDQKTYVKKFSDNANVDLQVRATSSKHNNKTLDQALFGDDLGNVNVNIQSR